jgi:hypothetical protein
MDKELKKMLDDSKIDKIYSNSLFGLKSISEHLGIWDSFSDSDKFLLENISHRDSYLNKNYQYKGKYDTNLVYGEITKKGVETIIEKINKYRKVTDKDVFVDIGSGSGKLVMHLGVKSTLKTLVGVELVEIRHKYAKHTYEQVSPIDDKSIFFINKSALDFDLSIATIIFINDVAFDNKLNESIYDKIPRGCHFITSKLIPECKILKEEILLDNSWSTRKEKFYYYIK